MRHYRLIASESLILIFLILFSINNVNGYELQGGFEKINGDLISFNNFQGTFLFIEAMWTECHWCQEEHPILNELYNSHGSSMVMISLAIYSSDNANTLSEYGKEYPTAWHIGLDVNQAFKNTFNIESTPQMLLFDREGNYLYNWRGYTEYSKMQVVIDSYLSGEVTTPQTDGEKSGAEQQSIIGDIFRNPAFQVGLIISIALLVYFQMTKKSPIETT